MKAYHHGDLRRALLDAAVDALGEAGPAALSLRDLARRAGVSHAAPAHHFGDKAGLLTAVAIDGYRALALALAEARVRTGSYREMGVAYVGFAVGHRAHFEVMFRPDLHRPDDPELRLAATKAGNALAAGARDLPDGPGPAAGLAGWSTAHGFATLWLSGALPRSLGPDPIAAARTVLGAPAL
ncbi:TetR/AcrR family transcriptional regulator [Catenuloplanes japonicus]|uniref:TetR/AcrR family transcriptional regulator n=1 Tax=Catenuloplanes japonicus TaxID=33876 RepID=UPI000524D9C0|nr:TetR/AcrR family transcriptional regulator [Catenuloplanes japonicus]